jgi:hypothetical protein
MCCQCARTPINALIVDSMITQMRPHLGGGGIRGGGRIRRADPDRAR